MGIGRVWIKNAVAIAIIMGAYLIARREAAVVERAPASKEDIPFASAMRFKEISESAGLKFTHRPYQVDPQRLYGCKALLTGG